MTLVYTFAILSALLAAACIVLIIRLFAARRIQAESEVGKRSAESALADLDRRLRASEAAASESLDRSTQTITTLTAELSRANTLIESLREQGVRDKAALEQLQESFRIEFRNMANDILHEKSEQFKKSNKEAIDVLLKPFGDSISDFRQRVEKIYSEENQQRGALRNEIRNLQELNRRITEETTNLTNALKGNSKVQGDWGEVILETILESSSLVKGIHYATQENLKDEYGNNLRPDVILYLPGGKQIVIDSKVSLTAYVEHCSAEDDSTRRRFLDEHVASVRRHVNELGAKKYQQLLDSPDFVIMFVPNEPAFMAALQCDSTIWDDAYTKKVIVSSPTNLFALLKIVDDLWKRDNQSRNAIRIAEEGAKLYDKFVGFIETLESVGKGIRNASDSYERAVKQLRDGPGNLIGRTEKLRALGVKATKSLPAGMAVPDDDPQEEPPRQLPDTSPTA